MSSQKGNASRTRPQKHQNTKVFKNNLHDKSKKTQVINSTQVKNSCNKCKAIIEWKIKYKKYKQLKSPKTCTKCSNKTVKQSYHTICDSCVAKLKICAKCGTADLNNSATLNSESVAQNSKREIEDSSSDYEDSDESEYDPS